ncbi:RsmB/NOP family class I SAM-dependent RNA methyltransferase [Indioceanicola profundi]|uniref:RsmB/NOP family class I SAM-dependent RNA methyltransferase n=1 Tax=Indioceanicola profundi TaxID=2220096 RepID=UPI000E6AADA0|nr:RsmB/NOP family class I SAM-dependent RNA methyltransferase [Indioceanicola profundi]
MTPAARFQAAVELLSEIEATARPADAVTSFYFKNRRFIGSKDRQEVSSLVYSVIRHWARLHWWLERVDGLPKSAVKTDADSRALLLAEALLIQGRRADSVSGLFNSVKFGPAPLTDAERKLLRDLDNHTVDHPQQPERVRAEVPEWAEEPLRATFGERFVTEMSAMLGEAPLDLRVNPVKATREQVIQALTDAGLKAAPTSLSPWGVRLRSRFPVATLPAFKEGWFEIQDEGSQLVSLIADAQPGMQVVDFCAGAGGKTLAMAAMMDNRGRVMATDVLANRLERAKERFRRAGLHNIETRGLSSERDPWVKRHKRKFDRVVVDAPCTGTGTWRRNPDSRWRTLGPGFEEILPLQANILDSAARLTRPGGRLVYATCSLLPEENERQVEAFLAGHPDFELLPMEKAWPERLGPVPASGDHLRLTPARHDTDGFFAAVMVRKEEVVEADEDAAAE